MFKINLEEELSYFFVLLMFIKISSYNLFLTELEKQTFGVGKRNISSSNYMIYVNMASRI
jgi:hypothetical protein